MGEKMTIIRHDGTRVEVEPLKMWDPKGVEQMIPDPMATDHMIYAVRIYNVMGTNTIENAMNDMAQQGWQFENVTALDEDRVLVVYSGIIGEVPQTPEQSDANDVTLTGWIGHE